MQEPLIGHWWVFGFHVTIVVTNILSLFFSISWVWYICAQINITRRVQKRLEREYGDLNSLKETQTKKTKYIFYLVVMLIEALHVALRLIIYIIFTILDFFYLDVECTTIGQYRAYYFIENLMPYQFIWIGLSHSLALALMISLIITLIFLRESYSYYKKNFKWIKFWFVFGCIQLPAVWLLLSIPWVALLGSISFIFFAIVDFSMLYTTAKRLFSILNMRLFDLRYENEYHMFRRALLKFRWFGLFLLSLGVYLIGIFLAHLAIWLSISPCYFQHYLNIGYNPNTTEVLTIANVASVAWLLDYLAIAQFDIVLVFGNILYFIYARATMKDTNAETRLLLRRYTESISS